MLRGSAGHKWYYRSPVVLYRAPLYGSTTSGLSGFSGRVCTVIVSVIHVRCGWYFQRLVTGQLGSISGPCDGTVSGGWEKGRGMCYSGLGSRQVWFWGGVYPKNPQCVSSASQ